MSQFLIMFMVIFVVLAFVAAWIVKGLFIKSSKNSDAEFIRVWLMFFIVVAAVISAFVWNFAKYEISNSIEHWGQMGDFFGGMLNPILAFASFIALLYTIRIQSEELRLTRDELTKSNETQRISLENQCKQIKLQKSIEEFNSIKALLIQSVDEADNILRKKYTDGKDLRDVVAYSVAFQTERMKISNKNDLLDGEELVNIISAKTSSVDYIFDIAEFKASSFNSLRFLKKLNVISARFDSDDNFEVVLSSFEDHITMYLVFSILLIEKERSKYFESIKGIPGLNDKVLTKISQMGIDYATLLDKN